MRKVVFFMMVSANGFYERAPWEIDWHQTDDEFNTFAIDQLRNADTLIFGRKTYEGMASYWPTAEAIASDPAVATLMNDTAKIVFSHTLKQVSWQNTRVAPEDAAKELRSLKSGPGKDLLILGSSDLTSSLARGDVVDEFRLMVVPRALPSGRPVLGGLEEDLALRLIGTRSFANGNVLLRYAPAAPAQ